MAYIDKAKKARIAEQLAKVVPAGWTYSLAIIHSTKLVFTLRAAPVDVLHHIKGAADGHADLNQYWLDRQITDHGIRRKFEDIVRALNAENFDQSDAMSDYIDVGYYVDIRVGQHGKPFVCTARMAA